MMPPGSFGMVSISTEADWPRLSISAAPGSVMPSNVSNSQTRRSVAFSRRNVAMAIMIEPPRHTPHSTMSPWMRFCTMCLMARNSARPRAKEVIV